MGPKGYAAIMILALSAGAANAQSLPDPAMGGPGDAAHGAVLFKQKCGVCHQPDKGAKNGVGPALWGAYGRAAGQAPGFAYSANVVPSGVVWTPEKLNLWIQKPASVIPGVKMVLAPVTNPQDRADIIAFLKTEADPVAAAPKAAAKKKAKG